MASQYPPWGWAAVYEIFANGSEGKLSFDWAHATTTFSSGTIFGDHFECVFDAATSQLFLTRSTSSGPATTIPATFQHLQTYVGTFILEDAEQSYSLQGTFAAYDETAGLDPASGNSPIAGWRANNLNQQPSGFQPMGTT